MRRPSWSPIRFQADVGILLTFMFIVNMIGSLLLVPALSHFLLNNRRATPIPVRDAADTQDLDVTGRWHTRKACDPDLVQLEEPT